MSSDPLELLPAYGPDLPEALQQVFPTPQLRGVKDVPTTHEEAIGLAFKAGQASVASKLQIWLDERRAIERGE